MSVIDEMFHYHAKLAKSVRSTEKRPAFERRSDVLDAVRRLRDVVAVLGAAAARGEVCDVQVREDLEAALGDLLRLDTMPLELREAEGPATKPMRAVAVVSKDRVLTDALAPEDET